MDMSVEEKTGGRASGVISNGRPVAVLIVAILVVSAVGYYWWNRQKSAFEALPKAAQADGLSRETRELMDEWSQPLEGKLAGRVVGIDDFGVVVEDFNGQHWYAVSKPGEVPGREQYAVFMSKVRVVGEYLNDKNFDAREFLPWVEPATGS